MGRTRSLGIALLAAAGLGVLVVVFRGLGGERGRDGSMPRLDGDVSGGELDRVPVAAAAQREAPMAEAAGDVPVPASRPTSEPRAPAGAALVLAFDGRILDESERSILGAEVRLMDGRVLAVSDESGRVAAEVE